MLQEDNAFIFRDFTAALMMQGQLQSQCQFSLMHFKELYNGTMSVGFMVDKGVTVT